ncbi:hypothetical protein N7519_006885 [Penicillium mononematosum]|uniref:uncharacterized protein n=1 Tax=Penicillium mononematosum TaxID=268346 RepID=UPI002549546E|nr:uncharacterized protein N7519_006885 [Penicillium mononematosum]KAJ6185584.1 hypothetical protein N7519_006885 [Penicillium mononematosum]
MSKRPRSRSRSPSLDQDSISVSSITVNTTTPPSERNKLIDSDTNILPEDYEVHYLQSHVNRCSECSKNFPTGHFLNIHIEENHDPLAAARRARGDKTYGCFIEDCERKCSTPQKRRLHLIDKHMFPKTYNFYIVNDGIDKQTSMLRPMNSHRRRISTSSALEGRLRRRSSASQSNPPETAIPETKSSNDMDIDELEKSMSALKFVPTSVTRNRNKVSGK